MTNISNNNEIQIENQEIVIDENFHTLNDKTSGEHDFNSKKIEKNDEIQKKMKENKSQSINFIEEEKKIMKQNNSMIAENSSINNQSRNKIIEIK